MTLLARRLALLVLALTLGAVLAGCATGSSDTKPQVLPSPAVAASPASPSPPVTPEAEVEAAVRAYYEAANRALRTGDTADLSAASTQSCACLRLARGIQEYYSHGRIEGAAFTPLSVGVQDIHGITAAADVTFEAAPYVNLSESGEVVQRFPSSRHHRLFSLMATGGRWLVTSIIDLDQ